VAAAHAVLDVIEEEKLVDRANLLGDRLRARLEPLRRRAPAIAEVRGLGAMVAIELMDGDEPAPDLARAIQSRALAAGLVLLTCGIHGNALRFLFPLTIPDPIFAEALDILETAIVA